MDIEKTKRYYDRLSDEDICDCVYCRNYVKEIRSTYQKLAAVLDDWGVDIQKPFETIPIGPAEEIMYYAGAQYVIMGPSDDFKDTLIDDVRISVTDSHPMTEIDEDHFVIEISSICLKWNETKKDT
ncbi:MAG: hypothetical protein IIU29_00915 [Erysipelotrichaceae bacterium]|nr:hypothetical protein [Erysipelotrichaceae bacterium]